MALWPQNYVHVVPVYIYHADYYTAVPGSAVRRVDHVECCSFFLLVDILGAMPLEHCRIGYDKHNDNVSNPGRDLKYIRYIHQKRENTRHKRRGRRIQPIVLFFVQAVCSSHLNRSVRG